MRDLLMTEGKFFDDIVSGVKRFDYRTGHRDVLVGDIICFKEANAEGICTGRECFGRVNYVLHSRTSPLHFKWNRDEEFTIIQFELEDSE